MTDDLTRGYEGQDDNVTESAEATTSETGTESSVAMVGQAGEAVVVSRPAPGQTVEIQAAAGQTYVLDFPPGEAQVQVQGNNFILAFDDDGDGTPDSQIVFNGLVNLVDAGEAPTFQVAGVPIDSSVLLNQALAFAGEQPDLIDVAAGPVASGGGSTYDDNLGDAIDLLVAQGVIPPVELQFGLIGVEPDPIILEAEEEIPLLINEIGVRVAMEIPGGEEPLGAPTVISDEDSGYFAYGGGEYGDGGGGTTLPNDLPVTDTNGSIETAQEIARSDFGIAPDPNVDDDSQPRVQIQGLLNEPNDLDYYCVELEAGETITLDVDFAWGQGDGIDPVITLLDENGNVVAYNDDSDEPLDPGSVEFDEDEYDSFLTYTVPTSGKYYVVVSGYDNFPGIGGDGLEGSDYTGDYVVQVSIDNFQGADPDVSPSCEEELPEYNFVELVNTSAAGYDPSGLVLQILGEDLGVTAFTIPGGVPAIPAGGFIVFYQLADPQDDGTPGTEDIVWRVFNADGDVVSGGTIADAPFWDLGDDTTDPIGVNLLTGGESVDTFAANITDGQLAALTDPEFGGAPDGFGSPLLDLNFDTFNGQFTGNHHIFSRVDLDDTDSQADWTTNNIPTDGALNDTDLSQLIGYTAGDGWLMRVDLETGDVKKVGYIGPDIEGLTFGTGENANSLFGYEDNAGYIVKIDPITGNVVQYWYNYESDAVDNPGFSFAADGKLYVVGDDNQVYEVLLDSPSSGDFSLSLVAEEDIGDFSLTGLAGDPTDANTLYAIGYDEETGTVKLFVVNVGAGTISQLPGTILQDSNGDDFGLSFDNQGRLWAVDQDNERAFQVDPATGNEVSGTSVDLQHYFFSSWESLAIAQHIIDQNPWDPLNDDMNPGQNNPDPLAGQNFIQGTGGDDQLEGRGGPDFLLGGAGNDSLYGGSEDLYLEQKEKVLNQAEQLFSFIYGGAEGGAASLSQQPYFNDHNDFLFGDAGDDEIYGGSGGDYMIGGQGNDSMDGGTGDDQIYGDGSDEEGGVGGLPDSDPNHAGDDVIAGDALNNVDFYGGPRGDEVSVAVDVPYYYYDVAGAVAIMGGNDTILAGNGDDKVGGDALAEGSEGAIAYSYADDSYERPADGLYREDAGFGNDTINGEEGNDSIGGDAAAVVDASGDYGYGYEFAAAEGFNIAAFGEESDAQVGSDSIEGGEGNDIIGGDAMAVVSGSEGYADADAYSLNVAYQDGYQAEGCEGYSYYPNANAGNDSIVGDTIEDDGVFGEYGYQFGGNDTIGGDAAASVDSFHGDAGAYSINDAEVNNYNYDNTYAQSYAGNDFIVGDMDGSEGYGAQGYLYAGSDTIGGDAAAVADGEDGYARADADNYAYGHAQEGNSAQSVAGNDTIIGDNYTGYGLEGGLYGANDVIGGDAAAAANGDDGYAYGSSDNGAYASTYYGGSSNAYAGNDTIIGDNAYSGAEGYAYAGNDTIGGDAAAVANGTYGDAFAHAENDAANDSYEGGSTYAAAGNDFIYADDTGYSYYYYNDYNGHDLVGGDAAASATGIYGEAEAEAYNSAEGNNAYAGNDTIYADNYYGGDYGEAGNDSVGGDAAAKGYDADAWTENEAYGGGVAGADTIYTYDGDDVVGGDSLSVKTGNDLVKGTATTWNSEYGNSRAGTDYIDAAQGNDMVGGDSAELAQYGFAHAVTHNTAISEFGKAGDDTIFGGSGNDTVAGGSLAYGEDALAETWNTAWGGGSAGNDSIDTGSGDDAFAGDSLAIKTGEDLQPPMPAPLSAYTYNTEEGGIAGSDSIISGSGADIGAGDSAEFAEYGSANARTENSSYAPDGQAGDDTINSGTGADTVAGGSLAKGVYALAETDNDADSGGSAGNDSIDTGSDGDTFSGDSLAIETGGLPLISSAHTWNTEYGNSTAGSDSIESGSGSDIGAGDAAEFAEYGYADAYTTNHSYGQGGSAGNDTILAAEGDDTVAGGSLAKGLYAYAETDNVAYDYGSAGNDSIDTGDGDYGNDVFSGDSLAIESGSGLISSAYAYNTEYGGVAGSDDITTGDGNDLGAGDAVEIATGDYGYADAYTENTSTTAYGQAGDDTIDAGDGDDTVSGGSLAKGYEAEAHTDNQAYGGGSAGNDSIDAGEGENLVAGDAQAIGDYATADGDNYAYGSGSEAGGDDIVSGTGSDTISGGAMAAAAFSANADQYNDADNGGSAGDDDINAGTGGAADDVAGDAMAISEFGLANADATNDAFDYGSTAGNDTINAGDGANHLAGDAMAVGVYGSATADAYGENLADAEGSAGNDSIIGGADGDVISGGSQARAVGEAEAEQVNTADSDSSAGDDSIAAAAGENLVAGDAQAISSGSDATATATNTATDSSTAGNDTITAGDDDDTISGGAQAQTTGTGTATATNTNLADVSSSAGNDDITSDGFNSGDDVVSGDAQALSTDGHAVATAVNGTDSVDGGESGNDVISTGGYGDYGDLVAGDSMAKSENGTATAYGDNNAYGSATSGNDEITSEEGHDTISGGALASAYGNAKAEQDNDAVNGGSAGNDVITADYGDLDYDDVVAGDALAHSESALADADALNTADQQGSTAGNDQIDATEGENTLAGDALASSEYGTADAYGKNDASEGGSAGDDIIYGGSDNDTISGGVLAASTGALASIWNKALSTLSLVTTAGNDTIDAEEGDDDVAGDALAIGDGATAGSLNDSDAVGDGSIAQAGDDLIYGGAGNDEIAGDAASFGGDATAENDAFADEYGIASSGDDRIFSDDTVTGGNDTVGGDALVNSVDGLAKADNDAEALDGGEATAGNDYIDVGAGADKVAGDAMASGAGSNAEVTNDASALSATASAGDDTIWAVESSGIGVNGDLIAGDGAALDGDATVTNTAYGSAVGTASAGSDDIIVIDGDDTISGGALAGGTGHTASATNDADAEYGSTADAGDDTIYGGFGEDTVAGDALATGEAGVATADNDATATEGTNSTASAGSDDINLLDDDADGDLIAGDAASTASDGGDATLTNDAEASGYGNVAEAGNDVIITEDGDDTISGGALAAGVAAAAAAAVTADADNTAVAGDDSTASASAGDDTIEAAGGANTVAGDALTTGDYGIADVNNDATATDGATASAGSDSMSAGDGDDTMSGDALATGDNGVANVINTSSASSNASAGSDEINAGGGVNIVAGDAAATGFGGSVSVTNLATAGAGESHSGDDTITTGDDQDFIAGEAMSEGPTTASNTARTTGPTGSANAGNDIITAGGGDNVVSGGSFSSGKDATLNNLADVSQYGGEANAGNDEVRTGTGNDIIAGESLVYWPLEGENPTAEANNTSTATAGDYGYGLAMAGNDLLVADKGDEAGDYGNDTVSGDALVAPSYYSGGDATANNSASATQGDAGVGIAMSGNDDITLGYGDDLAAGDAMTLSDYGTATGDNDATVDADGEEGAAVALAGNDIIDAGEGSDVVGGDAVATGEAGHAHADSDATVTDAFGAALAGNDIILAADGDDVLAGDALATGDYGTALAENTAAVVGSATGDADILGLIGGEFGEFVADILNDIQPSAALAGNDIIYANSFDYGDIISGDALALGENSGAAQADNEASVTNGEYGVGLALAGNDVILAGGGVDIIVGDAGSEASDATANNLASVVGGDGDSWASLALAGNDLILSGGVAGGDYGELVSGDALSGGDDMTAYANNDATVTDSGDTYVNAAIAGSDLIVTGDGDYGDTISGGSLATGDGATADTDNDAGVTVDGGLGIDLAMAGDDIIDAGEGDNLVAGDALATGDYGSIPTATADNTATTVYNSVDGAEGAAISSAGDDGIGSPFAGLLGYNTTYRGYVLAEVAAGLGADFWDAMNTVDGISSIADLLINGGAGNDTISGDALASGEYGVATTHNTADVQATIVGGDTSGSEIAIASAGNDAIDAGDGNNLVAGDAMTSNEHGGDATSTNAATAYGDGSGDMPYGYPDAYAEAGSDHIITGEDDDIISGGALAASDYGTATANNTAATTGILADYGSQLDIVSGAGNDTIYADGGEGPYYGDGNDTVAGDALATGEGGTAEANNSASVDVTAEYGGAGSFFFADAGNDLIDGGDGFNVLSGDAATTDYYGGDATANNEAAVDGAEGRAGAGDDTIRAYGDYQASGSDTVAGDALTMGLGTTAQANNTADADGYYGSAEAGDDYIGLYGTSDDYVAGDALAHSASVLAETNNTATATGMYTEASAGEDDIDLYNAYASTVAGESLTTGGYFGTADAENTATSSEHGRARAGSDHINTGVGADKVSGGALAAGGNSEAVIVNKATASDQSNAVAGEDYIYTSYGADTVAGDALASSFYSTATSTNDATANDTAYAGAGNDEIYSGFGNDLVAGDAMTSDEEGYEATANNTATANGAQSYAEAGGDYINDYDGSDTIAGGALTAANGIDALTDNDAFVTTEGGRAFAGNDTIYSGSSALFTGDDKVGGESVTLGNYAQAIAENATHGAGSEAGNDLIYGGNSTAEGEYLGDDQCFIPAAQIAGESLALGDYGEAHATNMVYGDDDNDDGTERAGNDTIQAGDGGFTIAGESLATGYRGSAFANNNTSATATTLAAIVGSDSIVSGDGNDLISGDVMATNGGTAKLTTDGDTGADFTGSSDTIQAGGGSDTIAGDALAMGATGVAEINGAGDDSIDGGAGSDLIAGDALGLCGAETVVTDDEDVGADTIYGGSGFDTIYGDTNDLSESLGGDDLIYGGADGDLIYAGGGDDEAYGEAGNDQIYGGDGNDYLDGGAGNDTLRGEAGTDTLVGGEGSADVLYGGGDDDVLYGDNTPFTGSDNDTLYGGSGDDTMYGGGGDDDFYVTETGDVVYGGDGVDTIYADLSVDLGSLQFYDVENVVLLGAGPGNILGNSFDNHLIGNAGENDIYGFGGEDTLEGQGADDGLYGGADDDTLLGGDGNDYLDGGTGADSMAGGNDNDYYVVDDAGDLVDETGASGDDTVESSINYDLRVAPTGDVLGGAVENLILTGGAVIGTGNALNNRLVGNANANVLNGLAGADTMEGGLGNDTYYVAEIGDVVIEAASEGTDLVYSNISYVLGANVENLDLLTPADIDGTGNSLNNEVFGNSGANTLSGLAGDDTLRGESGDDSLLGGAGDDSLVGGADNDTLDGGTNTAAGDTMEGGLGNDTYIVDSFSDVVIEAPGEGTDTVHSSVSFTLGADVENLTLTGFTAVTGTGNAGGNIINGNNISNVLDGQGGADTIIGGGGDDTLEGGLGDDSLSGGLGDDTFYFDTMANGEADVITDFNLFPGETDLLDLRDLLANGGNAPGDELGSTLDDYLSFDTTTTSGTTIITIDDNGSVAGGNVSTITLQGTDVSGLGATDEDIINTLIAQGNLDAV